MTDNHTKHKNACDAAGLQASPCTNPLHHMSCPGLGQLGRIGSHNNRRQGITPTRSSTVSVPHTHSPTTSIGAPAWVQQSPQPTSVRQEPLEVEVLQRTAKQHNPYSSPPTLWQGYLPHREHPTSCGKTTTHALQRTHSGIGSLHSRARTTTPLYRIDLFLSPKSGCLHTARMPC